MLSASPIQGPAQEPAEPVLEGIVVRDEEPMPDGLVTLHRVAQEAAGQVDTTQVDGEGRFRFELPTVPGSSGEDGEVYFASVRHQGVLYFGSAISRAAQLDSVYRIQVHDTTASPPEGASFRIAARNLLLEEADEGWTVVDLFRLQNERDRTVVASEGDAVWMHPLPPEARNFEVGESDLAPSAVSFEEGGIRVSSPVPPGERTYLMRYDVPEFEFTIPVTQPTERFEILLREPAPELTASGLSRVQPVEIEPGSNYRRFAGADLQNTVVEITEGTEGDNSRVAWLAVILGLVLAGAAIVAVRKGALIPAPEGGGRGGPGSREEILLRIAELDDAFREREDLSAEQRQRYEAERRELKARLQASE